MRDTTRFIAGGVLLGIGFGGFVDGIVLHQVLQWHHMVSDTGSHSTATVAGLEANTLADGIFHVATWIAAALGTWFTFRAASDAVTRHRYSNRELAGNVLLGWGGFNVVEGVVDHLLLGIHHVNETVPREQWLAWDLGFLVLAGLVPLAAGAAIARAARREHGPQGAPAA